jgi:two-component system, OmpR family, response regulator
MVGLACRMKLRIFLVEDSEIMSTLLQELLQGNGATIVGHSDSAKIAIADIALVAPDVVIVDIALRQGNGFDVLKSLSGKPAPGKQPAAAKPPVRIVLTNYTLTSYRTAAKRMGADYFFDKSNEIPEMLRVIRALSRRANKANGAPS